MKRNDASSFFRRRHCGPSLMMIPYARARVCVCVCVDDATLLCCLWRPSLVCPNASASCDYAKRFLCLADTGSPSSIRTRPMLFCLGCELFSPDDAGIGGGVRVLLLLLPLLTPLSALYLRAQ